MRRVTLNDIVRWKSAIAVLLFCAMAMIGSLGQTYHTIVNFNGADGAQGNSVTQGFDGSLYGTTFDGGTNNVGTVYKIASDGQLSSLYSFCNASTCTAGFGTSPLVQGEDGDFYGTNYEGGFLWGAIYTITPSGTVTTLHDFVSTDGAAPNRGMVLASDGNFYGTTYFGGTADVGTIFKITPNGSLTSLYSFCVLPNCTDGSYPIALLQGRDDRLYGATSGGGAYGYPSTIFRLNRSGLLTTLYTFGNTSSNTSPLLLVQGRGGDFFGLTTPSSLSCPSNPATCGTVFKLTPSGTLTTLYTFCSQPNCADGWSPGDLILATDGNFYGTTQLGGIPGCGISKLGCGTIFKVTPWGTLTTIHSLTGSPADGEEPTYLTQNTDGSFFGTTYYGGSHRGGTVFQLSTGLGPFVKLVQSSGKVGDTGGILGQGFIGTTDVFLNGTPASFTVISDTYISATVPAGATTGLVAVKTPSRTLISNAVFQVTP